MQKGAAWEILPSLTHGYEGTSEMSWSRYSLRYRDGVLLFTNLSQRSVPFPQVHVSKCLPVSFRVSAELANTV